MLNLKKKTNDPLASRVLLVILDGVGYTKAGAEKGNAVDKAKIPTLKGLWSQKPTVLLQAHGKAVGMPSDDDMGNSEVGHNALGAGRVFDQGAKLVSESIASGSLFAGNVWKKITNNAIEQKSTLHFLGLFSDGNVHSHIDHLKALIENAIQSSVHKIRIHILLDGRDVPEKSAMDYLIPFEEYLSGKRKDNKDLDICIASGGGRMTLTMDRYEADWNIVQEGWKHHVLGIGREFKTAKDALQTLYTEDPKVIDQYLPGFVIVKDGIPVGPVQDKDSLVFFNFRGDRAIEISRAFTEENFSFFDRVRFPKIEFAGMMQYDGDLHIPKQYLVPPPTIDRTMGEYLAHAKLKQYALSETQKFGHVTFFWNGNRSGYFDETVETYQEIRSDVIPFDQKPEMKAGEITEALIQALNSKAYSFLRVNYANGDMVGHTGNLDATVQSLEFLDECLAKVLKVCEDTDTVLLITADHGNADEMFQLDKKGNVQIDSNGKLVPKTSHTLNPVQLVVVDPKNKIQFIENPKAGLGNVASTVFDILGFESPEGYLPSLIKN